MTADAGEERIVGEPGWVAQPRFERGDGIATERRASVFPAFPQAAKMRARPQDDVLAFKADHFGDAQSRLESDQEKRAVAAPDPGR